MYIGTSPGKLPYDIIDLVSQKHLEHKILSTRLYSLRTGMTWFSVLVNAVAKLVVKIVGNRFGFTSAEIKKVAEEIVKQWINYGIKITVQAIEEFITKVQESKEPAYKKTKDAVYEMLESAKATAGFAGRLFESVVSFGVHCLRYAVGNINGQELICRTRRSVDSIMRPSAKPLVGSAAGAVTGAAIGSAIPGVGTVIGGLVGAFVGSYAGVVVARNT